MSPSHALLRRVFAGVLVASAGLVLVGCSASGSASVGTGSGAGAGRDTSRAEIASDKGGAQLWTENCSRCHNVRSPDYYSPGQWAIVMEHMRVRAYLTGEEERQIMAFLQSQ